MMLALAVNKQLSCEITTQSAPKFTILRAKQEIFSPQIHALVGKGTPPPNTHRLFWRLNPRAYGA